MSEDTFFFLPAEHVDRLLVRMNISHIRTPASYINNALVLRDLVTLKQLKTDGREDELADLSKRPRVMVQVADLEQMEAFIEAKRQLQQVSGERQDANRQRELVRTG